MLRNIFSYHWRIFIAHRIISNIETAHFISEGVGGDVRLDFLLGVFLLVFLLVVFLLDFLLVVFVLVFLRVIRCPHSIAVSISRDKFCRKKRELRRMS